MAKLDQFTAPQSALLLIDLQYFDVDPAVGALSHCSPAEQAAYLSEVWERALPASVSALEYARAAGLEVIHVRIQSLTQDGRDRSSAHKQLGIHVAPGSKHAEFLPGLEPLEDEIVLNKTSSDAFHSTALDRLLRNLGVAQVFLVGVLTDECVASTARSASDLGFSPRIIAEGCATVDPRVHASTLARLNGRYAQVVSLADFQGSFAAAPR